MSKKKFKYIRTKTYDDIAALASKLGVNYNTIAVGYGVQPYAWTEYAKYTVVSCHCSLDNYKPCVRPVNPNSEYGCHMCEVYKKIFYKTMKEMVKQ